MLESNTDERAMELSIQASSAPVVEKKETGDKVKRMAIVSGAKKVENGAGSAAYRGDSDKGEGGNAYCIPESDCDEQTQELNIQASSASSVATNEATLAGMKMVKKEQMHAAYHGDNDQVEESTTADSLDPTRPFEDHKNVDLSRFREWCILRSELVAKSIPNDIIISDPTPKRVRDAFLEIAPRLEPILEKDSVPSFLRLFEREEGMHWNLTITAQTLTHMVIHDATSCAKVVLEGKKPELHGMHANPNCMNSYGYLPLHQAAEMFSVNMIKLLIRHGASANVRTVGNRVIEGLLPLHVAVQNTCLHKYLEDNLSSSQDPQDYIYNLIHLLCLPEMKIFLDTVRLLAAETDNLVDELWNYIKGKKLVEAAVLLLAAQGQIRGSSSSKKDVNCKQNGFEVITGRMLEQYEIAQTQLDERTTRYTSLLVRIISQAGTVLDGYIRRHSKVPHAEVLNHVSSILKDFGFDPTGEGIDVRNLRPYDCKMPDEESHDIGHLNATKAVKITPAGEKAARKKKPSGWDPEYTRRMFFPYWRSVLLDRCLVRVYPSYAPTSSIFDRKKLLNSGSDSMGNGSSRNLNHNLALLGRTQQPASNHQPRRLFATAAFASYGSSRNPNQKLSLMGKNRQPANNCQTRRLFGSAAFILLKLLKNA